MIFILIKPFTESSCPADGSSAILEETTPIPKNKCPLQHNSHWFFFQFVTCLKWYSLGWEGILHNVAPAECGYLMFRNKRTSNINAFIFNQEHMYSMLPAILMSQARAISSPPPNAAPSIAAIVGMGRLPKPRRKENKNYLLHYIYWIRIIALHWTE